MGWRPHYRALHALCLVSDEAWCGGYQPKEANKLSNFFSPPGCSPVGFVIVSANLVSDFGFSRFSAAYFLSAGQNHIQCCRITKRMMTNKRNDQSNDWTSSIQNIKPRYYVTLVCCRCVHAFCHNTKTAFNICSCDVELLPIPSTVFDYNPSNCSSEKFWVFWENNQNRFAATWSSRLMGCCTARPKWHARPGAVYNYNCIQSKIMHHFPLQCLIHLAQAIYVWFLQSLHVFS